MPEAGKSKNSQNKKGLGRGLGSLLASDAEGFKKESPTEAKKVLADKKPTSPPAKSAKPQAVQEKSKEVKPLDDKDRIWSLAIDKIFPNKKQPRKDFEKEPLQELAQSIKEQGLLQPITVRKKGENFEIIAGERRWRACQLAGLHSVPTIIKEVSDQKSMELALIENIQRENLNPVEEALAYQLLIDEHELSQQDLAQKVGKNRSTITNSLRVLTLPKEVRDTLRTGELSLGHAKVLLGIADPKLQIRLAKKTIQKKLSVRALEKEIKKSSSQDSQLGELNVSERLVQGLASDLQKALGTKVNIVYKAGKGRLEISYYSDEDLTRICEKIKG